MPNTRETLVEQRVTLNGLVEGTGCLQWKQAEVAPYLMAKIHR